MLENDALDTVGNAIFSRLPSPASYDLRLKQGALVQWVPVMCLGLCPLRCFVS